MRSEFEGQIHSTGGCVNFKSDVKLGMRVRFIHIVWFFYVINLCFLFWAKVAEIHGRFLKMHRNL